MIYFVEQWNAKPTWKALPTKEKQQYVTAVMEATQGLISKGIETITWSENTTSNHKKADYDYFAIWSIPNESLADEFLEAVEGAGWYNYFDQTNILGGNNSAPEILNKLVQLT